MVSRWICFGALTLASLGVYSQAPAVPATQSGEHGAASVDTPMLRSKMIGLMADEEKIVSPHGVQKLVPLKINGITQWISIRGNDVRNPILLFVHGGPGAPEMPESWMFERPWEDYFTVVQWDQRGAGKTLVGNDRDAQAATLNVKQMTADGAEVVRYLQQTYGKKKIFLLGHSWGSVLGVAMAQQHPEWFYAYIGVGQVVNIQKNETLGYSFAVQQAKATNNEVAEQELAAIAPYPGPLAALTLEKVGTDRKWVSYFGGMEYGRSDVGYVDKMAIFSPEYSEQEAAAVPDGEGFSTGILAPEMLGLNFEGITVFKCPVLLFEGRHDWTVPHPLAAAWFEQIKAPSKKIVWFEDSAHMPMMEEPGHFLMRLVTDALPLAEEAHATHP